MKEPQLQSFGGRAREMAEHVKDVICVEVEPSRDAGGTGAKRELLLRPRPLRWGERRKLVVECVFIVHAPSVAPSASGVAAVGISNLTLGSLFDVHDSTLSLRG